MPKNLTFGACVATVFAGVIATMPGPMARADDCLAAPNRAASPGTHWVPHVDRATNRKCWYLVDAGGHPAPAPDGDSIGTLFSKWLTGGPDAAADPRAAPGGHADDAKPRTPRQPDTQASLNPKPHKPPPAPAAHPVADPPGNQADSDALFRQFLRWKEHQPPDKQRQSEQTPQ